jgi:predicted nuclease of predicted toxin-antitoxin system
MNIFALIYLDEDVSNLVARLLRSRGMDVTTVQEHQMLGKSDPEQLAFSASISRCILTQNRVDYEKLHLHYVTNGIEHSGIVIL